MALSGDGRFAHALARSSQRARSHGRGADSGSCGSRREHRRRNRHDGISALRRGRARRARRSSRRSPRAPGEARGGARPLSPHGGSGPCRATRRGARLLNGAATDPRSVRRCLRAFQFAGPSARVRRALAIVVTALVGSASAEDLRGWRTPGGGLYFGAEPPPGSTKIEAVHPTPTEKILAPAPVTAVPQPAATTRPAATAEPTPPPRPVATPAPPVRRS